MPARAASYFEGTDEQKEWARMSCIHFFDLLLVSYVPTSSPPKTTLPKKIYPSNLTCLPLSVTRMREMFETINEKPENTNSDTGSRIPSTTNHMYCTWPLIFISTKRAHNFHRQNKWPNAVHSSESFDEIPLSTYTSSSSLIILLPSPIVHMTYRNSLGSTSPLNDGPLKPHF